MMLLKVAYVVIGVALVVVLLMLYGMLELLLDFLTSEKSPQIEKSREKKPLRRATRLTDHARKWLDSKGNGAKEVG